jgi:hypothetical protein
MSDNNLDQIRELLFGQQLDAYENRFSQCGDRLEQLEDSLHTFQGQVQGQFQQLEGTITDELTNLNQSLEKKLKYFSTASASELGQLELSLNGEMNSFTQELSTFQREINQQFGAMKGELENLRQHLDQDLNGLKEAIAKAWNDNFSELNEGKLTKDQLGKMLFEFSLKTRDGSFLAELPPGRQDQIEAELES